MLSRSIRGDLSKRPESGAFSVSICRTDASRGGYDGIQLFQLPASKKMAAVSISEKDALLGW